MKTFKDMCRSLDRELVRDQDSVVSFYWQLAKRYDQRLLESLEYLSDRADLLQQDMTEHLIELDLLEQRYLAMEEYEKCSAVRDLRAELTKKYKEWTS